MKIERPTVTIEKYSNGDSTYSVTAATWKNAYVRRGPNTEELKTRSKSEAFLKEFNRLADEIEQTGRTHAIMRAFVQHNLFYSVRKLEVDENTI